MSSSYQQRRNSLNRSLQFEYSAPQDSELSNQCIEGDVNQNYNNTHHNRFARIMHTNNHHSNNHKNSQSYDNHYATLDESVLNYTQNSNHNQGGGQIIKTPIKNIYIQKMNNNNNNNNNNNVLTSNSNNNGFINNNYVFNSNLVSLSLEQPKRGKARKNNLKNSLTQAEKVYSAVTAGNGLVRPNPLQTPGASKEKRNKIDIESLQNRILNEGARGYAAVKESFNNIIVNYAPNQNQVNPASASSAKLSQNQNRMKNGLQSNVIPSSTRQNSNQNQQVIMNVKNNAIVGSTSKNSDNLNTTMSNNRCSSMMSFHEETPNMNSKSGFTKNGINSIDVSGSILDTLIGNDTDLSQIKEKQYINEHSQPKHLQQSQDNQGNQTFLKQNEIKYINSIKQKMNQNDNNKNNQSVSARYHQQQTNQLQGQQNDQKSLYNVTRNNRYGDNMIGNTGEQSSKSNNSIKSILTEKRKFKIDENQQNSINNISISYNQLNRSNLSAAINSSGTGQKFILKENNPNITLDSSLAIENQKINFDSYNIHSNNNSSQGQSFPSNKGGASGNNLYIQQPSTNSSHNRHQQLMLGNNSVAPSTNNHTSKSINIVNRSSNFTTSTNQIYQKNRDHSYDSIQYGQLPSQQQYSFILNPHNNNNNNNAQYNTIGHSSNISGGFGSSKGSTSVPKRKKIQINSKLLNTSQCKIGQFVQDNTTASGGNPSISTIVKQKSPQNKDNSSISSQVQRSSKNPLSQISQNSSSLISQNPNQNLLYLLQKVSECFSRFKGRQEQINGGQLDKKVMENIVYKYVEQNQMQNNNSRENNKSPYRFSQSDSCTPAAGQFLKPQEFVQNKNMYDKNGYQVKQNDDDGKSDINDRSTTLNSNNSQKTKQSRSSNGAQSSASNIIRSISQTKQNAASYKYHKIGFNILSRLFKKKYSYQFFIQLIRDDQKSHLSF